MDKDYTWYIAMLKYCKDYYERFGEVPRSFPYKRKVYRKAEFINYIPSDFPDHEERWNGQGSLSREVE